MSIKAALNLPTFGGSPITGSPDPTLEEAILATSPLSLWIGDDANSTLMASNTSYNGSYRGSYTQQSYSYASKNLVRLTAGMLNIDTPAFRTNASLHTNSVFLVFKFDDVGEWSNGVVDADQHSLFTIEDGTNGADSNDTYWLTILAGNAGANIGALQLMYRAGNSFLFDTYTPTPDANVHRVLITCDVAAAGPGNPGTVQLYYDDPITPVITLSPEYKWLAEPHDTPQGSDPINPNRLGFGALSHDGVSGERSHVGAIGFCTWWNRVLTVGERSTIFSAI